jgi:uncharacterized ion transporter superfamily protein YfcC
VLDVQSVTHVPRHAQHAGNRVRVAIAVVASLLVVGGIVAFLSRGGTSASHTFMVMAVVSEFMLVSLSSLILSCRAAGAAFKMPRLASGARWQTMY